MPVESSTSNFSTFTAAKLNHGQVLLASFRSSVDFCLLQGKARDVKWCQAREEVLSLDVKGFLKIWTADLTHKADVSSTTYE